MATGRIGVTPTLGTRWSKAPAGGTTSLSGLDDNSVSLVYSVGYEQVYRNGVLLSRTNDYTATTGNSITLIDATIAGDIIEVFANELVPLTDAISKGQFTAKGALLSATAASTPAVLTVGSNNQVLTADSSTSTGLKWATASASPNFELINAGGTALTGASTITISGISGKNSLFIYTTSNVDAGTGAIYSIRLNSDSTTKYTQFGSRITTGTPNSIDSVTYEGISEFRLGRSSGATGSFGFAMSIEGCNSAGIKHIEHKAYEGSGVANSRAESSTGFYSGTSTISSISIISDTGNFTTGTIYVYGA